MRKCDQGGRPLIKHLNLAQVHLREIQEGNTRKETVAAHEGRSAGSPSKHVLRCGSFRVRLREGARGTLYSEITPGQRSYARRSAPRRLVYLLSWMGESETKSKIGRPRRCGSSDA